MKKICSYAGTHLAYNIPYTRQANVYESEEPVYKGCSFEVSTHGGSASTEWEFKAFKTLEEAQAYALSYVAPPYIKAQKI